MKYSPETWHNRYREQARWTQQLRAYLFEKANLVRSKKILEVGCGTGAVIKDFPNLSSKFIFGLDISRENLILARKYAPGVLYEQADAHFLPFPDCSFDIVYTHFVLLWLKDPFQAICEMRRVTQPGGYVLALAEPDYGGRIDNPIDLSVLGVWQAESLRNQGANPLFGRKLGELFLSAGFSEVQSGVLGGEWSHSANLYPDQSEWEIILSDLELMPEPPPQEEIQRLKAVEGKALESGNRLLYVPTFYAIGIAPN